MNTIQSEWEDFRDKTIPKDASITQLCEMMNSFYAGALCATSLITEFSSEDYSENAFCKMVDNIIKELKDHQAVINHDIKLIEIPILTNNIDVTDKDN